MQYVLGEILRLVGNPSVQANIKVLITSPWGTDMTRQFFQWDGEILHMEGLPTLELTPSASRVVDRYMPGTGLGESDAESSYDPSNSPTRR